MTDADVRDRLAEHVRLNPDTSAVEAVAAVGGDPSVWVDAVADALDAGDPVAALRNQANQHDSDSAGDPLVSGEENEPENGGEKGGSSDETPTPEPTKPPSSGEVNQQSDRDRGDVLVNTEEVVDSGATMFVADYSTVAPDTYQSTLAGRDQWMVRGEKYPPRERTKAPFAPWNQAAKWGEEENRAGFATAKEWNDTDPRSDGLVFIQLETDPFAFVDGDDVRDPETGEVHPAFRAILQHLGATYTDVSTSGTGAHAYYRAEAGLPIDGKNEATFQIDTEPWGANDSPPTVEIYANKHVNITTGDHVADTPLDLADWNDDALRAILEANGFSDKKVVSHDTDRDRAELNEYDAEATTADETAGDVRDVLKAVDALRPHDLPLRTRQTGEDSTGWSTWNPSYRSSDSGASVHSPPDEAVFHDHKMGEAFGLLGLFAAEQGIISNPWDRLEGGDWWDAVDEARDAGAPIPEFTPRDEREPVAPIALAKLDALEPDERRRAARKRGLEIPSTDDARSRLRDAVVRELRAGNTTVLDAPTALGKSYTVATEPWLRRSGITGDAPVIQLHQTREARDEAAGATADSMATGAVLKGRKEVSPLARGDHDPVDDDEKQPEITVTIDGEPASEWFDRVCDEKGLAFSTALAIARERNDQNLDDLPPVGEEDPAVAQWDGIPRDDDGSPAVDVIHATHQFAHVPSLRTHTNLIFDEQPDFSEELSQDRVRNMVAAYLKEIGAPTSSFEAFVMLARNDDARGDAANERDALENMIGDEPPTEWFVENGDAHALAPGIAEAIWNALRWEDTDANGRRSGRVYHEPPRFDTENSGFNAGTWLSVVIDDDHTVQSIRATPDLSQSRAVLGLDAHPSMPLWELNTAPEIDRDAVLDATERRLWRRYERGLTVVQVGDATRPRSGDKAEEWMNDDRVRAVLQRLREQYGDGFKTALSTVQTERRLRELLGEVAPNVDSENTMHFGEEKSRNDFADERAGYVYGCMDPGDDMILDALAELGLNATPSTVEAENGDQKREKGRTFDGDDADKARAVLASVRENHVAQAAGRYARNADDDDRATVFLHTDAAPVGFVDAETPGVQWIATDLQREIVDVLADRPAATVADLADAVDCSKQHVRDTLERLENADTPLVERDAGAGAYGADVYRGDDATDALADLGGIANSRLKDTNRWSLAIEQRHTGEAVDAVAGDPSNPPIDALAGGDAPPDLGD